MPKSLSKSLSSRRLFLLGVRDTVPLLVAATPFAIIYGALGISSGLSEWLVIAMSVFVFAGASQFIAVTLLASATAFPVILLTVFIVNLRHMLYAASLMPQIEKVPHWLRAPMAFWLTDETFAVVSTRLSARPGQREFIIYYLGSAISMYLNWIFFSWLGMTLGQNIPDIGSWGLDVAMVVAFVGIVVPILKNHADWACALTAAVSGVLSYNWPNQTGLLFSSLLAISVGMLLSHKQKKKAKT